MMDPTDNTSLSTCHASPEIKKVIALDDFSNRRVAIPEVFFASGSIVNVLYIIIDRIKIDPKMIEAHSKNPLPFIATNPLLAAATLNEKDRQETSELFRKLLDLLGLKEKELGNFLEIKNGGLGDSHDRLLLY